MNTNDCKEAFKLFDQEGSDVISTKDLGVVLRAVGLNPSEKEIAQLIKQNDNTVIELESFMKIVDHLKAKDSKELLLQAFQQYDDKKTGRIPKTELKYVLLSLDESLSNEEVETIFTDAGLTKETEIDYKHFIQFLINLA